ncbi:unnamed protein product [Protopolystoma xenopodis]|uniref:Uncharacterized protein n=1 Tax=Protopolystoma xenopodis TaxID=117903 RepID=A0A448X630_9PLAT|nr:unnamed protein product [Protopolystoma xenopodis]
MASAEREMQRLKEDLTECRRVMNEHKREGDSNMDKLEKTNEKLRVS